MNTHILVATDGSDTALKAVDFAAELAAKFDLPLTIGHVMQFDRSSKELARMAEVEHLVEEVQRLSKVDFQLMTGTSGDLFAHDRPGSDVVRVITLIGQKLLEQARARAAEKGATRIETVSDRGDAADCILEMVEDAGADMIVVGHRGLGRVRYAILGSVAQKVVQRAGCTVVSVR